MPGEDDLRVASSGGNCAITSTVQILPHWKPLQGCRHGRTRKLAAEAASMFCEPTGREMYAFTTVVPCGMDCVLTSTVQILPRQTGDWIPTGKYNWDCDNYCDWHYDKHYCGNYYYDLRRSTRY